MPVNPVGVHPRVSISRFNRRLHALSDWLYGIVTLVGEAYAQGEVFVIDTLPLPVCKQSLAPTRIWHTDDCRFGHAVDLI